MGASIPHVPEALMEQFHQATERFHQCKVDLEKAMDSSEYRHQEHVDATRDRLREAEREVEAIEEKIKQTLAAEKDGEASKN